MNYKHANEVTARECGVTIETNGNFTYEYKYRSVKFEWSISDPRCREMIRERFNIQTYKNYMVTGWTCNKQGSQLEGEGKSIAEAEIACILAIVEVIDNE